MLATLLHLSGDLTAGDLIAGDLIVGLGTVALAFFTWRLARETRESVAEAAKSAYLDALTSDVPVGGNQWHDAEISSSTWPTASRAATLTIEYTHSNGKAYVTSSEVTIDNDPVFCRTYRRDEVLAAAAQGSIRDATEG